MLREVISIKLEEFLQKIGVKYCLAYKNAFYSSELITRLNDHSNEEKREKILFHKTYCKIVYKNWLSTVSDPV